MIKSVTAVEFGKGNVGVHARVLANTNMGIIELTELLKPAAIGSDVSGKTTDDLNGSGVFLSFSNVQSVEVMMKALHNILIRMMRNNLTVNG